MEQHLIHRQILDLRLDSKANAFQIQGQFKDWYGQQFLPVLEEVFAQISEGRQIRLERLHFDFGRFNAEFNSLSRAALRDLILDQLIQQLPELFDAHYPKKSGIVQVVDNHHSRCEAFLFFLKNGRLPWWQANVNPGILDELLDAVVQSNAAAFTRFFNSQWTETIQNRLLKQYQPEQIFRLLGLINPVVAKEAKIAFAIFREIEANKNGTPIAKELLSFPLPPFIPLMIQMLRQQNDIAFEAILKTFIQLITKKSRYPLLLTLAQFKSILPLKWPQTTALHAALDHLIAEQKRQSKSGQAVQFRDTFTKDKVRAKTAQSSEEIAESSSRDRAQPEDQKDLLLAQEVDTPSNASQLVHKEQYMLDAIGEEGVLVEKAGLVLLWPYLGSFFRRLGLLDGLQFKDEWAQERAVILSYYLAEETATAEEYLMLVPKLLCAWPLHLPVDRTFQIREEEKADPHRMGEGFLWADFCVRIMACVA
ncbi:MAG: contractile injection system tape measure protein [Bacteroidota bacterium]